MKRACLTNTNKYEDISCEFHPTLEINYLRMKMWKSENFETTNC